MFPNTLSRSPKYWRPKLSPFWIRFWRPFRRVQQRREQRLEEIEVRGLEHLQEVADPGQGVLIVPNHPGSADAYAMYHVADELGTPFYFMAAWQLFQRLGRPARWILQRHGVFSVDREGADLRAFKTAVDILKSRPNPLVIFPEGEVYHVNDRITPFREGPATIALSAAKRGDRPVVVVPAAIKYYYTADPTPELVRIMDELERKIFWRPQSEKPLAERIYRFAEGPLALKELEYLGRTSSGPLPERVAALREDVLQKLEAKYVVNRANTVPERIKALRQQILQRMEDAHAGSDSGGNPQPYQNDLDDVFFCVQLFSYPGDYVDQAPTIERIAETIDKFAEDVLGRRRASVCASRRIVVALGEAIPVDGKHRKTAGPELTRQMEQRVQNLLDAMPASTRFGTAPDESQAAAHTQSGEEKTHGRKPVGV